MRISVRNAAPGNRGMVARAMTWPIDRRAWFLGILLFLAATQTTGALAAAAQPARPAYETETWPKTRTLTWANPGQDGLLSDKGNWKENGRPASAPPNEETDVVLPASEKPYTVNDGQRSQVRHLTIEKNASLVGRHRGETEVWGNLWVKDGGKVYYVSIRGPRHTFFRIDGAEFPNPSNKLTYGHTGQGADRRNRTQISHKFQVCKFGDASVEFIGKFGVSDEIMVQHGKLILSGDLRWSGVTSKGALEIYDGGILELQSGATAGPLQGINNKSVYNIDVYRNGVLQAGSPERPLTADTFLMLGFGANDKPGRTGLFAAKGSQIRVYSSDPAKHRLVITSITSRADFFDGKGRPAGNPDTKAGGSNGIALQVGGDMNVDGVHFDYVCNQGIRLADRSAAKAWKNVTFGPHNAGPQDGLFGSLTADANAYYHNRSDMESEFALTTKAVKSMDEYMKKSDPYKLSASPATIEMRNVGGLQKPMPVLFKEPVTVTINCALAGAKIHFTLDGKEPDESAPRYTAPFQLKSTCRLTVRAYKDGQSPSPPLSTAFVFKD